MGEIPSFFARMRNQTAVRAVLKAERREAHGGTLGGNRRPWRSSTPGCSTGWAYARTGSRADAEDVMQEVFVPCLLPGQAGVPGRRSTPRPGCCGWAHAAPPMCSAPRGGGGEGPLDDGLPAPEPPGEGGVVEAVLALPAKYRMAVHLYYYEELSVAEIAGRPGQKRGGRQVPAVPGQGAAAAVFEGGRRCFRTTIGGR